jgi:transcriptional regulator with XRE-family HTH domain
LKLTDREVADKEIPRASQRAAALKVSAARVVPTDGDAQEHGSRDNPTAIDGFGARLQALRQQHGLTLAQLAEAASLSVSFLSLLENDKSDISLGRLARLVDALGVQFKDLIYTGEQAEEGDEILVRADQRRSLRVENGIHTEFLARSVRSGDEHMLMTFGSGAVNDMTDDPNYRMLPGESFYLVLEGEMLVEFIEGGPVILYRGDSLSLLHENFKRVRNLAAGPTLVFVEAHFWPPDAEPRHDAGAAG